MASPWLIAMKRNKIYTQFVIWCAIGDQILNDIKVTARMQVNFILKLTHSPYHNPKLLLYKRREDLPRFCVCCSRIRPLPCFINTLTMDWISHNVFEWPLPVRGKSLGQTFLQKLWPGVLPGRNTRETNRKSRVSKLILLVMKWQTTSRKEERAKNPFKTWPNNRILKNVIQTSTNERIPSNQFGEGRAKV